MADLQFALEPLKDCWDEVVVLARQHYEETQGFQGVPFNPKFERYNAYEEAGWYLQFTARVDGKLVGYAGLYLTPSMHTQQLVCTEDTWYLDPSVRKGFAAIRFFKFMEAECKRRGVTRIFLTAPHTTRAGIIHKYLKYEHISDGYSKAL